MSGGRVLAVDFGAKNVGLACCDELGIAIQPLESVPNRGGEDLLKRLRSAVGRYEIARIVVGIPWNMDGSAGSSVRNVERFMQSLRAEFNLPLSGVDERLSTEEALEAWRDMSLRQRRRYRTVDSLAAALILQRFLREP